MASTRPIKLSKKERELLALLPKDGQRISTNALVEAVYGDEKPFNARVIISGRMRAILAKQAAGCIEADVRLQSTRRSGPNPMEFWLVPS